MLKIRTGRGFMVVAYPEYRFFVSGYGVSVYDKKGRRVGLFATEAEAINYLQKISNELGSEAR